MHYKGELRRPDELLQKYARVEFADQAFKKGSVPALKILAGYGGKKPEQDAKPPAEKKVALGKKEQRALDAQKAVEDNIYTPPAPPTAVNGKSRH